MPRHLRYVTFAPGELEARLRELAPNGQTLPLLSVANGRAGGTLLKAHCSAVRYPDGGSGECRYERFGPRWHLFHYAYEGQALGRHAFAEVLGNDPASIEAKAQELTAAAYREAIDNERRNYFQRASEPSDGSRKRKPERYRMRAAVAKELAGQYALCRLSGMLLFPFGKAYDSIEEANTAWREKGDPEIVVGCCNRLDRCWQLPRFNTLYAEFDPRPGKRKPEVGITRKEEVPREMSRCVESAQESGVRCPLEAAPGDTRCTACAAKVSKERREFQSWMREVNLALEGMCGMCSEDLPDCPYADWHGAGLEPDEAAAQAMEWAS